MEQLSNKTLIREFWSHAQPYRKSYYASFVLMFTTLFFDLARPFILKSGLDKITQQDLAGLHFIGMIFLGFVVMEYISRSIFSYLINLAFLRTISRIREAIFSHVIQLKMAYFDKNPVGALLTRTVNDAESLGNSLRSGIATVFVDILTIIGIIFVMMTINLQLSFIIMIAVPIVMITVRWFGKKLRSWYLIVRKKLATSNAYMAEGISGVEIIQLFNHHDHSSQEFEKVNREYRRATIFANIYDASLYAVVDAVGSITIAALLYWALGYNFGIVEASVIIVYIDLVERIFVPVRDLSGKFATIQQALAALQRIFSLLHVPDIITKGEKKLEDKNLSIEFQHVSFAYKEQGPQVLEDINFKVQPGEVVALVGATGSGKSTIGRLFTRTYDGYKGHIYIGETEISDAQNLREKIAIIHQDVTLFPTTIRENITLGNPNITDEDVQNAIAITRVDRWINDLENGLDFEIKENGSNLSSGQGQLIVFARAMAHNTPIVLMDEATANIDSLTEKWIQEALEEIFKRKTVVVVAHRLSTIASADLILVMKNGEIMERGTHDTLMKKDGYYRDLVSSAQEFV
ncbi:ABC transporter ATP-binding protein [Candidatus Uabimicrobium amorphum]|uniref:ABC transporter ATP-binding protein n=1 Tax=Uabimicrobium amorphum TaxID=2596890 RepID=A0A5S9ISS1_UABAM|nr:ABC transporter ATP-binding protein [Candidatus Uabimicrobium amorphum]BBM87478.1 ABC transporter ATP-binding protein [Candidatus Uabimicrobium amorphum]